MTLAHVRRFALCAFVALQVPCAGAADADDPVLARNSLTTVTRNDFLAELQRVPPEHRAEFIASPKRVGDTLAQLLLRKSLALQARAEKLDATPLAQARIAAEADRTLAVMRMDDVEAKATAEFEAKRAAYLARARELYAADRDKYRAPEEISASHILVDVKKRSSDEAKRIVADVRARILAGADFNAVAKEVSDDPSAQQNSGRLGFFTRERMDPAFAQAAFALKRPGDVSEPVQSSFGWHLIRLEEKKAAAVRAFDDVKDEILDGLKKRFIEEKRNAVLVSVRDDPKSTIVDPEVDKLRATLAADVAAKPNAGGGAR